ncbi:MAG: esterase family protein [Ignavibacterium sp.]
MKNILKLFLLILLINFQSIISQQSNKINMYPFDNFLKKVNSINSPIEKQKLVDEFIESVKSNPAGMDFHNYPIFENDTTVILLYQGNENNIGILGDMNYWMKPNPMTKIEGTNLFYYKNNFEANARLEYLISFSENTFPKIDILNPYKVLSGFGANSELAMPQYERHPIFNEFLIGKTGDYQLVKEYEIQSNILNYSHKIFIYLPPNYSIKKKYPTVYFQDGMDYIEFAQASFVINQLINENKIKPIIAVFVAPPNRFQPQIPNRMTEYGLNDNYVEFFSTELVNFIDSSFSTLKNPESRLVIGDSFGGLISVYIPFKHPEIFGLSYSQSGYHSFQSFKLINLIWESIPSGKGSETKPIKFYIDVGTYEKRVGANFLPESEGNFTECNRLLQKVLEQKNYEFIYKEYPEGHTWGNWRRHLIDALISFFPN